MSERVKRPVVILKLDDVSQQYGKLLPNFLRMDGMLKERGIKGSFGLICVVGWPGAVGLTESGEEYLGWVRELQGSGRVEFWFHGWDHATHDVGGEPHCEFHARSYEEQKGRFERGQAVAREKLGFAFKTFGPGGAVTKYDLIDENTVRAVGEDPFMEAFFYPKALDEAGRRLAAGGKVTVLERVPGVSLERTTGVADFELFKEGYLRNLEAEYFVLQGHPNPWDEGHFGEVGRILDFLMEEGAEFLLPREFARRRAGGPMGFKHEGR